MRRWLTVLLLGCALAGSSVVAATGTFRCGNDLIIEGDARSRVLAKCGRPTEVSHSVALRAPLVWRYGRPVYVGDGMIEVPVEVWTYNLGPNTFMRRLRFEDGQLVEVETLGYGFHPR